MQVHRTKVLCLCQDAILLLLPVIAGKSPRVPYSWRTANATIRHAKRVNTRRPKRSITRFRNRLFCAPVAMACVALLLPPSSPALAQQAESQVPTTTTPSTADAPPIPKEQLDSLVAPIALYPDGLLGQTLVASTYPLEIIQLQQWMDRNKNLKDKALADAVEKQHWDPSIQAMSAFPEVTQRLAANIQWTTELGNAFLAQQADVMEAVQRMRAKARSKGALESNAQQRVETRIVEGGEEVIVVDPANPQVVYVPSYDPMVVYGEPVYPYPPYYYPGYVPGMGLAFGTGLILGAAWGGNWGWGCGWGNGDINVNWNNNHVSHYNRQNNINRVQGGDKWQHRPEHRGNTPYGNRQTENKYGNTARNPSGRQPGTGPGKLDPAVAPDPTPCQPATEATVAEILSVDTTCRQVPVSAPTATLLVTAGLAEAQLIPPATEVDIAWEAAAFRVAAEDVAAGAGDKRTMRRESAEVPQLLSLAFGWAPENISLRSHMRTDSQCDKVHHAETKRRHATKGRKAMKSPDPRSRFRNRLFYVPVAMVCAWRCFCHPIRQSWRSRPNRRS